VRVYLFAKFLKTFTFVLSLITINVFTDFVLVEEEELSTENLKKFGFNLKDKGSEKREQRASWRQNFKEHLMKSGIELEEVKLLCCVSCFTTLPVLVCSDLLHTKASFSIDRYLYCLLVTPTNAWESPIGTIIGHAKFLKMTSPPTQSLKKKKKKLNV